MKLSELLKDVDITTQDVKVRRKCWSEGDQKYFIPRFIDVNGLAVGLNEDGMSNWFPPQNCDWEFYTEPKKKVKLYQYAYCESGLWFELDAFFRDDDDFKKNRDYVKFIRTMIEVEE